MRQILNYFKRRRFLHNIDKIARNDFRVCRVSCWSRKLIGYEGCKLCELKGQRR